MPFAAGSFVILDSVDSTNNYAMGVVHSGNAIHGMSYFTLEQTEGKGRRGKVWESEKGQNIILSVIVNTAFLSTYKQFYLSAAVALSCVDFFNKYLENIKIKWPNDLYFDDRKAGGILIENVIKGNLWQWSVIGIGININQTTFTNNNRKGISIKNITGITYDVIELGKELQGIILQWLDKLKTENTVGLMRHYNQQLYKLKEKVKLRKQNIVFETIITGVSNEGELITFDTMEKKYKP